MNLAMEVLMRIYLYFNEIQKRVKWTLEAGIAYLRSIKLTDEQKNSGNL